MKEQLHLALNSQINFEIHSSHIYLNISSYFADLGLNGFAHYFYVQFEEETQHAKRMMDYLSDRGVRPIIQGMPEPLHQFQSPLQAIETALAHEKTVTLRLYKILKLARELDDYGTEIFLQWFVSEQVEEEASFNTLVDKVRLVKDTGLYILDQELATRVLTPIPTGNQAA